MQRDAEKTQPATKQKKQAQPTTLPQLFDQQRKYDPKSPEAVKINKAVAEYICVDQVPIYTVEKPGFQQLLMQLLYATKYYLTSICGSVQKTCSMLRLKRFCLSFSC